MDVFETQDGRMLINELQSVFWAIDPAQMYVNGIPGRYKRIGDQFVFEEGRFCRNACCNARIEDLLNILRKAGPDSTGEVTVAPTMNRDRNM